MYSVITTGDGAPGGWLKTFSGTEGLAIEYAGHRCVFPVHVPRRGLWVRHANAGGLINHRFTPITSRAVILQASALHPGSIRRMRTALLTTALGLALAGLSLETNGFELTLRPDAGKQEDLR